MKALLEWVIPPALRSHFVYPPLNLLGIKLLDEYIRHYSNASGHIRQASFVWLRGVAYQSFDPKT